MKRLPIILGALLFAVMGAAILAGSGRSASAQATGVPDFTQFGFPQVVGSVTYTPGQTQTISAGIQQVVLPADFISKTVTFDLLQGDPSFFAPLVPITDQGRTVIVAFAFRVTDPATNQLVGRFDKPVQWSVTDPAVAAGSAVYNTTAANPPGVTPNSAPGTITGTTLAHPFGGAGVGWLVLGPAGAAAAPPAAEATATALPTVAPTTAPAAPAAPPTEVPVVEPTAVPVIAPAPGMPSTGSPQPGAGLLLLGLVAVVGTAAGIVIRRRRVS